jgi:hypothetical protein
VVNYADVSQSIPFPLDEQHGHVHRCQVLATLGGWLPGGMKWKAKRDQADHAGQWLRRAAQPPAVGERKPHSMRSLSTAAQFLNYSIPDRRLRRDEATKIKSDVRERELPVGRTSLAAVARKTEREIVSTLPGAPDLVRLCGACHPIRAV